MMQDKSHDTILPERSRTAEFNLFFVWRVSLVAAMGGLLFGYDWVVIGGARPFYELYYRLDTPALSGWGVSSALVGCLLGAVVSGVFSDKYGRKRLLLLSGLLFMVSAVGTALAPTFSMFTVFRILGGIGIGLASNLSPMYIAEISPAPMRGKLVSVNQLAIVIGVLAAQSINWIISMFDAQLANHAAHEAILESWTGQYGWRWMFAAETAPALLFFVLMYFVPESPRWLVKNGKPKSAKKILTAVGGAEYADDEVRGILQTLSREEIAQVHFSDILEPKLMKVLMIGIVLAVFQQWCGINVIFYYASDIFQTAGYDIKGVMLNIVITGLVMLIFTLVAVASVDRFGRKKLMLIGSFGLAMIYGLIGLCFHMRMTGFTVVFLTLAAIAFYSFSLAPVVWVILSEIFPNRIRGAAMSISVFALWVGSFTLSFTFPSLNSWFGSAKTFWLYGVVCVAGFLFVARMLTETKGKSLEAIERELLE